MTLPLEIETAFADLRAKLDGNHSALNKLQTLVVEHYTDVRGQLRNVVRRMERVEVRLAIPHEIAPEPPPKPLSDPPP